MSKKSKEKLKKETEEKNIKTDDYKKESTVNLEEKLNLNSDKITKKEIVLVIIIVVLISLILYATFLIREKEKSIEDKRRKENTEQTSNTDNQNKDESKEKNKNEKEVNKSVEEAKNEALKKEEESKKDLENNKNIVLNEIKTKKEFEEKVYNFKGSVIVDYYADWCIPCVQMKPVVKKLQDEGINIISLNVENKNEFLDILQKEGVMYLPTFGLYKDGKLKEHMTGLTKESELRELMKLGENK